MSRIALYYPFINFPNQEWLKNAILYNDKVGTIVPFSNLETIKISDDIRELDSYGLYQPYYTNDLPGRTFEGVEKFHQIFNDAITSERFRQLRNQNLNFITFDVYSNKLIEGIEDTLERENLIIERHGNQVKMFPLAAELYMSMLSELLANNDDVNIVTPTTDQRRIEILTYECTNNPSPTYQLELQKCLPVVSPDATLSQVIEFRRTRHTELFRFRSVLKEMQDDISDSVNQKEMNDKVKYWADQITQAIKDLQNLYGRSEMAFSLKSMKALLTFKKPEGFLFGAAATEAANYLAKSEVSIAGYVSGAIGLAMVGISGYRRNAKQLSKEAFSYLYYADQQGLLAQS